MPAALLTANRPDVLDEVFDGEAVLVNLATGRYFALSPSATTVWSTIAAGTDWAALQAAAPATELELLAFTHALASEQLLVLDGDLPPLPAELPEPSATAPSFEVFTDMEDLLKLDPIHDIDLDGDGWPAVASA
jgi:hypothetical protein